MISKTVVNAVLDAVLDCVGGGSGGGGSGDPVECESPAKPVTEKTHARAIAIAKRFMGFLL
jgi:hypothetical protein